MYLRRHNTLAQLAAGFGISVGTAHAYTSAVVVLLADRAPGLLRALRGVVGAAVADSVAFGKGAVQQDVVRVGFKRGFTETERFEAWGAEQWLGTWSPLTLSD